MEVNVYRLCECDSVAAHTLEEARNWYKETTGLSDDELYTDEEVEVLPPSYMVHNDEKGGPDMISIGEIVQEYWKGEPFIACSTEW